MNTINRKKKKKSFSSDKEKSVTDDVDVDIDIDINESSVQDTDKGNINKKNTSIVLKNNADSDKAPNKKEHIYNFLKNTLDFSKNAKSETEIKREQESYKIRKEQILLSKKNADNNDIDIKKHGKNNNLNDIVINELNYFFSYTDNIGTQLLIVGDSVHNIFRRISAIFSVYTPHYLKKVFTVFANFFSKIIDNCASPFKESAKLTSAYRYKYIWNREKGVKGFVNAIKGLGWYFSGLWKNFAKIADYILPILGCSILAACIIYFNNINYVLRVNYDGDVIGYVNSESEYYIAEAKMKERIIDDDIRNFKTVKPSFDMIIVDRKKTTDIDTLTNRILERVSTEVQACDGIYIDDIFLGAVEDGNEFLLYINSILDEYRGEDDYERIEFQKKITVKNGIYPLSSVKTILELKDSIESNQRMMKTVKVNNGETLEIIATNNNTTVDDILKLNPQLTERMKESEKDIPELYLGETLAIDNVELNLGIKLTKREVYQESIDYGTEYIDDNRYPTSYVEVVSNGREGRQEVVADVVYIDGEKVSETRLKETVLREPKNAVKKRGTLLPQQFMPDGSDKSQSFMWPVDGGRLTCGFYGYAGHTGMDIGAPFGTPIFASKAGTVKYATNYVIWPYGKRVDIDHGQGTVTRYAHMSTVLVNAGQYVRKGQLLGYMGATGNAYGVHLHFEVIINGKQLNPEDFIGRKYPGKQKLD